MQRADEEHDQDMPQQMADLRARALHCPRCPNVTTRVRVVFGEGDVKARVMFVGQGPGAYDEQTGRPFSGPSGMLLDQVFIEAGLERPRLWLTNLIKCRPVKREQGRLVDRAPLVAEIKACRPWLEGEMAIVRPDIVVCLGVPAAHALIDRKFKLSEQHGSLIEAEDGTRRMAAFHPAYVLRLRGVDLAAYERTRQALIDDLKKVALLMQEGL